MHPILAGIYGNEFDPVDHKTLDSVWLMLSEIVHLLDASREGLKVKDFGGHDLLFVRVPCLSSDKSFNNTKSWVDEALKNNGSTHDGTRESAFHVANHLCRFYQDSVCEALNQQGMVLAQEMSKVKYVTMMSALKITRARERILARYLREHLGSSFCPTQTAIEMLTKGHADIHTDSKVWMYQGKDIEATVEWWEMDIDIAIAQRLCRELQSRNVNASDVLEVQTVVGGDHGDTAFQFGAVVTVKLQSGDDITYELLSTELVCRKDTAALFEETVLPRLTKGLQIISEQSLNLYKTGDNSFICTFDAPPPKIKDIFKIAVDVYSTGDLTYQMMTQGR